MATNANAINYFSSAKWVVSKVAGEGTHTTIASALTSASSGDTIFIMPGTYTENPTMVAGVNLSSFTCDAYTPNVIINGKCTFTTAGTVSISGIQLQTNSDYFLAITGSAASVVELINCRLNCSNNTGINFASSSASSSLNIYYCTGDLGTTGIALISGAGTGSVGIKWSECTNSGGSTTLTTLSAVGIFAFRHCRVSFPLGVTSTATIDLFCTEIMPGDLSLNVIGVTCNGSGTSTIHKCRIHSGSSAAISIGSGATANVTKCELLSGAANAITGAGSLNYAENDFTGSSVTINTTTQAIYTTGPIIQLGGGAQILSGSGSPSGSITAPQGSLYLRTDGTTVNNRLYSNTNSGTGWTAITTVG